MVLFGDGCACRATYLDRNYYPNFPPFWLKSQQNPSTQGGRVPPKADKYLRRFSLQKLILPPLEIQKQNQAD